MRSLTRYLQGVCKGKAVAMAEANGTRKADETPEADAACERETRQSQRGADGARDAGKDPEAQSVCECEACEPADTGDAPESAAPAGASGCCCHHKATPRTEAFQRDLQKRLNRAIGQLNGVKAMIDDNRYCGDVLTQLAAAESAVHRVSAMLLQNHLETCVVEQIEAGNTAIIDEAMQLIKKFAR